MKSLIALLIVLGLGGGGIWWYLDHRGGPVVTYRNAPVKRGDLLATISSTGTIEPEEVVDIGAQVQGMIDSFGKDANGNMVDWRSPVNEGMMLAHIDDSLYQAALNSAKASLQQAQATQQVAEANMGVLHAKYDESKEDWDRAQLYAKTEAVAANDLAMYLSNFKQAEANLEVGKATVEQAKASVAVAQAALATAQKNVDYCTIVSPVKGEVIDRRVNIGQTVVSSLSAPSLFLLGKDLTRIQVWASVNEADIGHIKPGQKATFTVEAHPGRTFVGVVKQVRFNATMNQNVVTYTVEVDTDNKDGTLLPYQTATVLFETERRESVLQIPNAALRWSPSNAELVVPEDRVKFAATLARRAGAASGNGGAAGGQSPSSATGGAGRPTGPNGAEAPAGHEQGQPRDHGTVWIQVGPLFKPIHVKLGMTDGVFTELASDELTENQPVVVSETHAEAAASGDQTTNPFAPPAIFRRR